jgi:hypothetical protein
MAFDAELLLRAAAAGNLTATGQTSYFDTRPQAEPMAVEVVVPSVSGTTPTLDIVIEESDDGSTVKEKHTIPQINAAGVYHIAFRSRRAKARANMTLGGTTPNFGATVIGIVPAGRHKDR